MDAWGYAYHADRATTTTPPHPHLTCGWDNSHLPTFPSLESLHVLAKFGQYIAPDNDFFVPTFSRKSDVLRRSGGKVVVGISKYHLD